MPQELPTLADFEPSMGDLFTPSRRAAGHAVWTRPRHGGTAAPKKRIFHQRAVRWHGPAWPLRLGVRVWA